MLEVVLMIIQSSTTQQRVRRELACHRYEPALSIANYYQFRCGWVHGVVTQMCDCHCTISDGSDTVIVKLRPKDRRLHTERFGAVKMGLAAGRYPGVAIKLRYSKRLEIAVIYDATQHRDCQFRLLQRQVSLYVED